VSSPTPRAELADPPAQDVRGVSDTCKQRVLEREGIAMFVALHDARPSRQLVVRDPSSVVEGARLALLFEHYERGLAEVAIDPDVSEAAIEGDGDGGVVEVDPDVDPTGAAALIDVLVVLSDQHLRARTELSV